MMAHCSRYGTVVTYVILDWGVAASEMGRFVWRNTTDFILAVVRGFAIAISLFQSLKRELRLPQRCISSIEPLTIHAVTKILNVVTLGCKRITLPFNHVPKAMFDTLHTT